MQASQIRNLRIDVPRFQMPVQCLLPAVSVAAEKSALPSEQQRAESALRLAWPRAEKDRGAATIAHRIESPLIENGPPGEEPGGSSGRQSTRSVHARSIRRLCGPGYSAMAAQKRDRQEAGRQVDGTRDERDLGSRPLSRRLGAPGSNSSIRGSAGHRLETAAMLPLKQADLLSLRLGSARAIQRCAQLPHDRVVIGHWGYFSCMTLSSA
jgi:hypothetical protein